MPRPLQNFLSIFKMSSTFSPSKATCQVNSGTSNSTSHGKYRNTDHARSKDAAYRMRPGHHHPGHGFADGNQPVQVALNNRPNVLARIWKVLSHSLCCGCSSGEHI